MRVTGIVNGFQKLGPQVGMPSTFVGFDSFGEVGKVMSPEDIANKTMLGLQKVVLVFPSMILSKNSLITLCRELAQRNKLVVLNTSCNRFSPEMIPFVSLWRLNIPMDADSTELDDIVIHYMTAVNQQRLAFEIGIDDNISDAKALVARLGLSACDLTLYPSLGPDMISQLEGEIRMDRFWLTMPNLRILKPPFGVRYEKPNDRLLTRKETCSNCGTSTCNCVGCESSESVEQ